jgi:Extracellular link domain/PAN domain
VCEIAWRSTETARWHRTCNVSEDNRNLMRRHPMLNVHSRSSRAAQAIAFVICLLAGASSASAGEDPICWRDTERRDSHPLVCEPHLEPDVGLCYEPCDPGFTGKLNVCKRSCQAGYVRQGKYCVNPGNPSNKYLRKYYRGAGVPMSACPPNMEKVGALCKSACPEGSHGVAGVCWMDCPDERPYRIGAVCGETEQDARYAVSQMVLSTWDAVGNIALMVVTAGSATAAKTAEKAISTGVKVGLKGTLKVAAKEVGTELGESLLESTAQTVIDSAAAQDFEWSSLDPTGIAAVVQAFNHPICNQPGPMKSFVLVHGKAIAGHNDLPTHYDVSLSECAQLCEDDASCASAEYYFPDARCQRSTDSRDSVPGSYADYVDYAYLHRGPDPLDNFEVVRNMAIAGYNDFPEVTHIGIELCAQLCEQTPGCASAEYNRARAACNRSTRTRHDVGGAYQEYADHTYLEKKPDNCPSGSTRIDDACVVSLGNSYNLTKAAAEVSCANQYDGWLCTSEELWEAYANGFHMCAYGWLSDGSSMGGTIGISNQSDNGACDTPNSVTTYGQYTNAAWSGICCMLD